MNIIRQNIAFALATKAVFVGLTAFGLATMWGAIAADVGVSLLVVANALRLLRARNDHLDLSGGEKITASKAEVALAHGH